MQVGGAGEDAARNDVALDAAEPILDLVQPGTVGGREMHGDVGMIGEEGINGRGLVAADVVADDVNLAPFGLTGDHVREESNELCAGVTCRRLADDLAAWI